MVTFFLMTGGVGGLSSTGVCVCAVWVCVCGKSGSISRRLTFLLSSKVIEQKWQKIMTTQWWVRSHHLPERLGLGIRFPWPFISIFFFLFFSFLLPIFTFSSIFSLLVAPPLFPALCSGLGTDRSSHRVASSLILAHLYQDAASPDWLSPSVD